MTGRRQMISSALLLVVSTALTACERDDSSPTPTVTIDDTFIIVTPTADLSTHGLEVLEVSLGQAFITPSSEMGLDDPG